MNSKIKRKIIRNIQYLLIGSKGPSENETTFLLSIGQQMGLLPGETIDAISTMIEDFSPLDAEHDKISCFQSAVKATYEAGSISKEQTLRLINLRKMLNLKCDLFETIIESTLNDTPLTLHQIPPSHDQSTKTNNTLVEQHQSSLAGITIEFAETDAMSFSSAIAKAKKVSELKVSLRGKRKWHSITVPLSKFADLLPAAEQVNCLQAKSVSINGQEYDWKEVFRFVSCASTRRRSFRKIEYCFGKGDNDLNPWGCRWSGMFWNSWPSWLQLGEWVKDQKKPLWRFDKQQMRENLLQNIYQVRFCPFLNLEYIDAFLRIFPQYAEVTPEGPWEYQDAKDGDPDAVYIRYTMGIGKDKYTTNLNVKGVYPRSKKLLMTLIQEAASSIGATAPQFGPVLKPVEVEKLPAPHNGLLNESSGRPDAHTLTRDEPI